MAIATSPEESERLLDRLLEVLDELLRRFANVYGLEPNARHRLAAVSLAFDRLAREVSPRPQPADLADDEVLKRLAKAVARIPLPELFPPIGEDASAEDQLVGVCANVVLEALAECGRKLEGVALDDVDLD